MMRLRPAYGGSFILRPTHWSCNHLRLSIKSCRHRETSCERISTEVPRSNRRYYPVRGRKKKKIRESRHVTQQRQRYTRTDVATYTDEINVCQTGGRAKIWKSSCLPLRECFAYLRIDIITDDSDHFLINLWRYPWLRNPTTVVCFHNFIVMKLLLCATDASCSVFDFR